MSREDGLLLVGAALVCVQLFFALSWNLLQPPKIMCFQCANMLDFKVGQIIITYLTDVVSFLLVNIFNMRHHHIGGSTAKFTEFTCNIFYFPMNGFLMITQSCLCKEWFATFQA